MQVELQDIRKHFGPVKANDGISLIFESGRIYGLLGENGAGKSTLMKILAGYQPADSGRILLDGQPAHFSTPSAALKAGIGMVYQDPLDVPQFTVLENYLLGRDRRVRLNFKQAASELTALLDKYGFEVDPNAQISALSLGERQQLELVRLLAGGARALILDEPTTGISADQKEALFNTMRRMATEEGRTIILVSHKLDEIQELCSEAFVLRKGQYVGKQSIPCGNRDLVELMFGQVPQRNARPPLPHERPMLEIRQLSVRTPRLTIADINLEIRAGEVFGLAGLEGSGQDLLMRAIAGLVPATAGSIRLGGADITRCNYHQTLQAGVAYIAAGRLEEGLVAGLSLTEHIVLSAPRAKQTFFIRWEGARAVTERRIQHYEVVGTAQSNADQLSGGNQQRLLFAMLNEGLKLILLNQPTRGLDVRSADYIWETLYKRRDEGTAILFISPDLDEIIERSDRVAVFSGGVMSRVVEAAQTNADELGHLIGGEE
ncbi:MAG: ATP-binding cassette domain-containing protein [Anaerolineae bacterium]|nr:MAG: ATP-binding cassette domain-containing protein [Anaerolineae bacterium]